ncbi:MAG TPA: ATP-binding protein [Bdellovibrionota bacterium]|nr:ATP-binding protein [Bdellovibrionota bacterium]
MEKKKEVSGIAVQILIKFLDDRKEQVGDLFQGLPYSEEHIRDKHNWIDYETLRVLYDRIQKRFPDEDIWYGIGFKYTTQRTFSFWTVIGALLRSPASMFSRFPFFVEKMFGMVTCEARDLTKEGIVLRYRFREGYDPSVPFLEITRGILASGPQILGHPPSNVNYQAVDDRTFDFSIKWKKRLPLFKRIATAFKRLFNVKGTIQELEESNRTLQEKYDEVFKLNQELERYIKELKESQEQLVQAGKLSAIGELASGVAHELNNPLTVVVGYTEELDEILKSGKIDQKDSDECVSRIRYAANRMRRMVDHLRNFSRTSQDVFTETNLNEVVTNAFMMVEEQMKTHSIFIDKKLDEHLPPIMADPNQLEQVIINMFTNARDAMDDIKKENEGHQSKLTVITRLTDGGPEIVIQDNGKGISEEVREKIFNPFFTTKDVGKGTGLGLSISHKILSKHHAKIAVDSKLNNGTCFTLTFPSTEEFQKTGNRSGDGAGDRGDAL